MHRAVESCTRSSLSGAQPFLSSLGTPFPFREGGQGVGFARRQSAGAVGAYLLRRTTPERSAPASAEAPAEQRETVRRPGVLRCAACSHAITTEGDRIRINGSHDHHCVNPAGVGFRIGCFRSAPGCQRLGTPTLEFTWFAGCAWSYALCNSCGTHLGWCFEGPDDGSFFGLILNRLSADSGSV